MPSALLSPTDPMVNLAQAIVATSDTPLLMLDGGLTVMAASLSFCRAFGLDRALVEGRSILTMGSGEWDLPRLDSLLSATASGGADVDKYEIDLPGRDGGPDLSLELSAHKLITTDVDSIHLLLSIADTTLARACAKERDQLVADNLLLMQELQHRVANSLQIIASVLMQSARRVSNDETRSHLQMAQSRVLSIAAIQRQLSQTGADDIALNPYFKQLCRSLGASMIADPELLTIETDVDDTNVRSTVSVSLGLIVTELVINALKHAYPVDTGGKITVRYHAIGNSWTLAIEDDGVGMPTQGTVATAGLGTSIVEALARQLQARIEMADMHPGTGISIIHEDLDIASLNDLPLVKAI